MYVNKYINNLLACLCADSGQASPWCYIKIDKSF